MNSHFQYNDEQFESLFSNCSLNPALFNHTAHIRLAFIYIKKYGLEEAIEKVSAQIQQFDRTHGDGTKFDPQLTEDSVRVVHAYMQESKIEHFQSFLLRYPMFLVSFKSLLEEFRNKNFVE